MASSSMTMSLCACIRARAESRSVLMVALRYVLTLRIRLKLRAGVAVDTGIVRRTVRKVLTFSYRVGFMQLIVSARVVGRSPVECSHFVSNLNISSCTLFFRSDRLGTPRTSYLGRRCLIPALLLGRDTGLGSDPPVIRACRSFLE